MRAPQKGTQQTEERPAQAPPIYFESRADLATRFLFGDGLEIGPLNLPLEIPTHVRVRYVDRMSTEELGREYPELADSQLAEVDIIDDGERLETIPDASQDFIVANHFLEHCEDPISTIGVHLSRIRPGGVLFYAVPDKRFTFDFRREPTPLDHLIADHERGPEGSRRGHYEEWTRLVKDEPSTRRDSQDTRAADWERRKARELEAARFSIHMHVWTQAEFIQLVLYCRQRFGYAFDIEAMARRSQEFMVVLRKEGRFPDPSPSAQLKLSTLVEEHERLVNQVLGMTSSLSWRLTKPLRTARGFLPRKDRGRRRQQ